VALGWGTGRHYYGDRPYRWRPRGRGLLSRPVRGELGERIRRAEQEAALAMGDRRLTAENHWPMVSAERLLSHLSLGVRVWCPRSDLVVSTVQLRRRRWCPYRPEALTDRWTSNPAHS
jgi:hypothetical protein